MKLQPLLLLCNKILLIIKNKGSFTKFVHTPCLQIFNLIHTLVAEKIITNLCHWYLTLFSMATIRFIVWFGLVYVVYAISNNISVILWRSVLLVEETGVPGENHQPVASHWQTYHIYITDCLIHYCFWRRLSKRELILVCRQMRNVWAREISLHFGGGVLGGAWLRLVLNNFAEFYRKQIIVLK